MGRCAGGYLRRGGGDGDRGRRHERGQREGAEGDRRGPWRNGGGGDRRGCDRRGSEAGACRRSSQRPRRRGDRGRGHGGRGHRRARESPARGRRRGTRRHGHRHWDVLRRPRHGVGLGDGDVLRRPRYRGGHRDVLRPRARPRLGAMLRVARRLRARDDHHLPVPAKMAAAVVAVRVVPAADAIALAAPLLLRVAPTCSPIPVAGLAVVRRRSAAGARAALAPVLAAPLLLGFGPFVLPVRPPCHAIEHRRGRHDVYRCGGTRRKWRNADPKHEGEHRERCGEATNRETAPAARPRLLGNLELAGAVTNIPVVNLLHEGSSAHAHVRQFRLLRRLETAKAVALSVPGAAYNAAARDDDPAASHTNAPGHQGVIASDRHCCRMCVRVHLDTPNCAPGLAHMHRALLA
mmetsp:Transcript_89242/g.257318  ORF Transcript_89242/g.257318 Transcript_89242/m.257318 type:complete len:406 (+) Transcript_89242:384-1601(+)